MKHDRYDSGIGADRDADSHEGVTGSDGSAPNGQRPYTPVGEFLYGDTPH